jgi:4-amino-4-deoxy-L-arabinose transferase-like glycosyltransferase
LSILDSIRLPSYSLTPIIIVIGIAIIARFVWLDTIVVRDEGGLGYIALQWSRGFLPYEYSQDNKGPLAYGIYLFFHEWFGNSILPIRLFNNILFVLSALAIYHLGEKWFGRTTALIAATLYAIFVNAPIIEGQLATAWSLSSYFIIFSVYFAALWTSLPTSTLMRRIYLLAAVASASAVILILIPAVVFIPIVLFILLYGKPSRYSWRELIIFSLSLIVPILFSAFYLSQLGILEEMFNMTITKSITSYSSLNPEVPFEYQYMIIVELLPLWLLLPVGVYYSLRKRERKHLVVLVWLSILMLLGLYIQPHFGRHFLYAVAPLSLLGGIGLSSIFTNYSKYSHPRLKSVGLTLGLIVLFLSFVFAIGLQTRHFPNYNINWQFIHYDWAFAYDYQQQQKIVDFLRDNGANDTTKVLFHGWLPELYWLSGQLSPSIYVYTYRGPGVDIPQSEYDRILTLVEQQKFDFVIFLNLVPDEIMSSTRQNYQLIETIGEGNYRYEIYKKIPAATAVTYSFIDNFATAKPLIGRIGVILKDMMAEQDEIVPQLRQINESTTLISQHPPVQDRAYPQASYLSFDNVHIGANSSLEFGITMAPESWSKEGDGVLFEVFVRDNSSIFRIFSEYIDPKHISDHRVPKHHRVSLSGFEDKNIEVIFSTSPGLNGDANNDWAYWDTPIILTAGR